MRLENFPPPKHALGQNEVWIGYSVVLPQLLERVGKLQVPRAVRLFARSIPNREQQVEQERTLGTLIQSKSDVAD